ncbi:hypothetical protein [Phenylobacterium sp.]|uniref:hypothetical protein n=1 Tax=Phenylobacterium sp. TaxID=1871053 RepID=UPI003940B3F1
MSDKNQAQRFEEAAREAGADESGATFERVFKAIVPPKPRPQQATKKVSARRKRGPSDA